MIGPTALSTQHSSLLNCISFFYHAASALPFPQFCFQRMFLFYSLLIADILFYSCSVFMFLLSLYYKSLQYPIKLELNRYKIKCEKLVLLVPAPGAGLYLALQGPQIESLLIAGSKIDKYCINIHNSFTSMLKYRNFFKLLILKYIYC